MIFVGASFLEVIVPEGREEDVIQALEICGMNTAPTIQLSMALVVLVRRKWIPPVTDSKHRGAYGA